MSKLSLRSRNKIEENLLTFQVEAGLPQRRHFPSQGGSSQGDYFADCGPGKRTWGNGGHGPFPSPSERSEGKRAFNVKYEEKSVRRGRRSVLQCKDAEL